MTRGKWVTTAGATTKIITWVVATQFILIALATGIILEFAGR